MGYWPRSSIPNDKSRIQDRAGQNHNERDNSVIQRVLLTEKKYISQPGELFWTKQTEAQTPEDFWRRLIEIGKECNFESITAEELLISKFMTAITDKKLRDKLIKEKKPEMKKTIDMIKQNTYEKKNNKNTIPEALISNREKEIKEEPIQKMDKFNTRPRNKPNNNRPCRFCNAPNWNQSHKCPALDQTCNNCGKMGHFARA